MSPAAASITAGQIRRDAFFFPSGPDDLYASLYDGTAGTPGLGLLICGSWGAEGRSLLEWSHRLAAGAAQQGAAALVLHWPGHEDSGGDPQAGTMSGLVAACVDACDAAGERTPIGAWVLTGVRFGAAVAAVAAPHVGARGLILVQPELDPEAYVDEMERSSRRADVRRRTPPGWAFGHPLPSALRDGEPVTQVRAALADFGGDVTVVRYRKPTLEPHGLPAGGRELTVHGDWRRPPLADHSPLRALVLRALRPALKAHR